MLDHLQMRSFNDMSQRKSMDDPQIILISDGVGSSSNESDCSLTTTTNLETACFGMSNAF